MVARYASVYGAAACLTSESCSEEPENTTRTREKPRNSKISMKGQAGTLEYQFCGTNGEPKLVIRVVVGVAAYYSTINSP